MGETMVQDVLGEPESWANCISDQMSGLPDLRAASVLDVFVAGNKLSLYAQGTDGTQSVTVFVIDDQDIRRKIATVFHPGVGVLAALRAAI